MDLDDQSKLPDFLNRADDDDFHHLEAECFLSTGSGDYAEFIAKLFGTEIYFYRKANTEKHEFMHTLVGTFVSKPENVQKEGFPPFFPVGISLPPKYSRTIYFISEEVSNHWHKILAQVSETYLLEDFYKIIKDLGEGSMGVVRLA